MADNMLIQQLQPIFWDALGMTDGLGFIRGAGYLSAACLLGACNILLSDMRMSIPVFMQTRSIGPGH